MSGATQEQVIDALGLADDDFFALDGPALSALQPRVAKVVAPPPRSGPPPRTRTPLPELRALDAPAALDWRRRSKLPVVIAEVRSNQREWEVHGRQNRLLVVSNLDTGSVLATAPLEKGRRMPALPPSRSGAPPDAINAAVSSITVRSYDLLTWFTRAQLSGRLAVTFIEHDLATNTRLLTATGEAPQSAAQVAAPRVTARPAPPDAVPSLVSPSGVAFDLPETVALDGTSPGSPPARLDAHVRLPRRQVTVITAAAAQAPTQALAVTLLLIQLDQPAPVLVDVAAPAVPHPGDQLESAFSLDLAGALAGHGRPGDWLAYLIVGDTVTGPRPVRLTAR